MLRTPLALRRLPRYSRGEEILNMTTHIPGAVMGVVALVLCILRSAAGGAWHIFGCCVYGIAMTAVFTVSSIYHGLPKSMGKKVMQVVDHCAIYFLIAGTYTPILISGIGPCYPGLARGLMALEWSLAILAATLTAIDLNRFKTLSMVCYIGMGWAVIPFWKQTLLALTAPGFGLLLAGGIVYSIGAVLYGMGSRRPWAHGIFHIFVFLGALLQLLAVYLYAL